MKKTFMSIGFALLVTAFAITPVLAGYGSPSITTNGAWERK